MNRVESAARQKKKKKVTEMRNTNGRKCNITVPGARVARVAEVSDSGAALVERVILSSMAVRSIKKRRRSGGDGTGASGGGSGEEIPCVPELVDRIRPQEIHFV